MNPFAIATLLARILAVGIVSILHATGADKHRTIAGQVAEVLQGAADAADAAHTALSNQAAPAASQTP